MLFTFTAELKKLRSSDTMHNNVSYDLNKSRYYAMQLERKLIDALKTPGSGDLEKSLSSSLQSLEATNAELERYVKGLVLDTECFFYLTCVMYIEIVRGLT